MDDPVKTAVTLQLSQAFLDEQEEVKRLLNTWNEMMLDLDSKVASMFQKATDDLQVLCDQIEVDNIRQFEIYRTLLRNKYRTDG